MSMRIAVTFFNVSTRLHYIDKLYYMVIKNMLLHLWIWTPVAQKIKTDKSSFFPNNSSFAIDKIIRFMFKKISLATLHILMLI
jgi:hypothetical protein